MKKFLRYTAISLLIVLVIAALLAYPTYKAVYGANVPTSLQDPYLLVPTGTDYNQLRATLADGGYLLDPSSFHRVAVLMKFNQRSSMRAGRYKIEPGMSNRALIQHLRNGKQSPVNLTVSYGRLPEDVAGKASVFIEADSLSILGIFQDATLLRQHGHTRETAISCIIPNTYEFFWNTDAHGFWKRMVKEHKAFWDKDGRRDKAKRIGLTPEEVYTLASIVEAETNHKPERARVAGVYLNRLRIKMPLQADPTAKFATRDFDAKRVLNRHLEYDSPYNTYMYAGLPPGPIMLASISSIDAVLKAEKHDYLFFCAKPPKDIVNGKPFEHAFAKTLAQHNANARRYHAYLNKRKIMR